MRIVFTYHAKEQMKERKIQKVWVKETIKSPDKITRDKHKYYIVKKLNGITLKIVCVKEKYIKVITLFFIK